MMPSDYGIIIQRITKAAKNVGMTEKQIATIPFGDPPTYIKSDIAALWEDLSWEARAIAIISGKK